MNIASKVFYLQVLARCGYVVKRLDDMSSLRGGVTVHGPIDRRGRAYDHITVQILDPVDFGVGSPDATVTVGEESMSLVVHDDGSFDLLATHGDWPPGVQQ